MDFETSQPDGTPVNDSAKSAPATSAELYGVTSGHRHPLPFGSAEIGRGTQCAIILNDQSVSRRHCAIHVTGSSVLIEELAPGNPTLVNGRAVAGKAPLSDGDRITIGVFEFRFRSNATTLRIEPQAAAPTAAPVIESAVPRLDPSGSRDARSTPSPAVGQAAIPSANPARSSRPPTPTARPIDPTVVDHEPDPCAAEADQTPTHVAGAARFRISVDRPIRIGRDPASADVVFDHPRVSRLHASLTPALGGVVVLDNQSANGTFIDGIRTSGPTLLRPESVLKIGPFLFRLNGGVLEQVVAVDSVEIVCRNVTKSVRTSGGEQLVIIDSISLVLRPSEFICIIGPSGSGKSTLLGALSARNPASKGTVEINGIDLYRHFDALKGDIAVVPQKDILHESLSVDSALRYTARLRLPPDSTEAERTARIESVLTQVGLVERRRLPIHRLSGGQLKRTSLANELLSEPGLLFLDEVTSGLDDQSDGEMMQLFREVARAGRTVVCITHSLSHVASNATHVVVLTKGGKLAFFGPPAAACAYFQVSSLSGVYGALERQPAATWKARFESHPLYRQYVLNRLPAAASNAAAAQASRPPILHQIRTSFQQWVHLSMRLVHLLVLDLKTVATLVAQPLLVGLVLFFVIGILPDADADGGAPQVTRATIDGFFQDRAQRAAEGREAFAAFFFLMVAAFWFGANNAAKEIVKERQIYLREQDAGVGAVAYYFSKFGNCVAITLIQVASLTIAVALCCNLPGSLLRHVVTLCLLSAVGSAIGLLISATSKSEDRAVALVPLVLIPQVILSNSVAAVEGAPAWIAKIAVACYWAHESISDDVAKIYGAAGKSAQDDFGLAMLMLLLQGSVFVVIAVCTLLANARRLWIRSALRNAGFEPVS